MEYVYTTKTKRFETALDELIGELQDLRTVPDGHDAHKILEARIEQIEYGMAYLPEIFREGDQDEDD